VSNGRGPAFSADGQTLFFSAVDGNERIWSARREGRSANFGAASLVPGLDPGGSDAGTPFLSFDGLSLYFFSTRPGAGTEGDRDIWIAQRPTEDAPFGTARVLPGVNTAALEHLPRLSDDELSILFVSGRKSPHAGSNLWMATRANRADGFAAPVEVPGINSDAREEGFSLSKDGLTLVFASDRVSESDMDLWVSTRSEPRGEFGEPENLAALNSPAQDLDPQFSPDGSELFFTSSRPNPLASNGAFAIFRALRDCIRR
jgi:Tol biopolymer transport system component